MRKTRNSSTSRPKNLDSPKTYADYSAAIGFYALRRDYAKALALINVGLEKFKTPLQRYELFSQAGNCQKNQKIFGEAESLYKLAIENAYEPSHAVASLGLASCDLEKGDALAAEQMILASIDSARKQLSAVAENASSSLEIPPVPLSPQAIAMRAAPAFDRHGLREVSNRVLEYVIAAKPLASPRTAAFLARRLEPSSPSQAAEIYETLLSRAVLSSRDVDVLCGLLRIKPDLSTSALDGYLNKFRPVARQSATFAVAFSLRSRSDNAWKKYALELINMPRERMGKRARFSILSSEALKMLARDAEINRDWASLSHLAERFFSIKMATPVEKVSAIKKIAKASVLQTGKLDDSYLEKYCQELKQPSIGQYSIARAMMEIEEYGLASLKFQQFITTPSPQDFRSRARFNLAECYGRTDQHRKAFDLYREISEDPSVDKKFALIAASKMVEPLLKMGTGSDEVLARISKIIDESEDSNSLLDMARIMKESGGIPENYYMQAYEKGRTLALKKIDSSKDPKAAMLTIFQLGRRLRDLLLFEEFVVDYRNLASGRLSWLAVAGPSYWEYGAFVYEIMCATGRPVEAARSWESFVSSAGKKPSGIDLSHYHLLKGIGELGLGRSTAAAEFEKVIELAPLHVNASRAYYWLALAERGNGRIASAKSNAEKGLQTAGANGGYVWQQNLRRKLEVLANDFDIRKAAIGKNQVEKYQMVAAEVMSDLKKVEKLIG
jgi:tetratricopeptide (TPR) repeat protein